MISVTSSIIPISSLVNAVGGQYVDVTNIVPAGVSPHAFDLSVQQMARIADSEIVFLTGLDHIDGFLKKAAQVKLQVHLADGMELLEASAHDHEQAKIEKEILEKGHDDHGHHDDHGDHDDHDDHGDHDDHDKDPHVWLGKQNITTMAQTIRDELSDILPEHSEYFAKNTQAFIAELNTIYNDFETQVSGKTPREFIVFHDAYNYLMFSIGMDMDLKNPFSENVLHEPGAGHRVELITKVQTHDIKHIFKEPQFSEGLVQKFAKEQDLEMGTLDPIGSDPSAKGYLDNLQLNLENISIVYE